MLAKIYSGATFGLESHLIEVEVDVVNMGMPKFNIVGLPDKAVEESRERVRSAIKNSGGNFPKHKVIVNLAPADLPKVGPAYDLPIAVGILLAMGDIDTQLHNTLIMGELSLDGSLRHSNGILPITIEARAKGIEKIFVPEQDAAEAAVVSGIEVYPIKNLKQLCMHLQDLEPISPVPYQTFDHIQNSQEKQTYIYDFADIKGQEQAKRAAEIAAAGHHNMLLMGTPGAGKTMLARALPGIMPRLTEEEALEITKIYSVVGNIPSGCSLIKNRPYRSPHHTTSKIGLIGGGSHPLPGEISMAHRGVLFLDELPEFPRATLESLRQPLEDGIVTISRASGTVAYPAEFLLIAAANPCPCGYYNSDTQDCNCQPGQISRYQKKMSGPFLDRIDLHIHISPVPIDKLTTIKPGENTETVRKRVQKARDQQRKRFQHTTFTANGDMNSKAVKKFCTTDQQGEQVLNQAIKNMCLSARAYYRTLKVARTIADIELQSQISAKHIAEALQYRQKLNN